MCVLTQLAVLNELTLAEVTLATTLLYSLKCLIKALHCTLVISVFAPHMFIVLLKDDPLQGRRKKLEKLK